MAGGVTSLRLVREAQAKRGPSVRSATPRVAEHAAENGADMRVVQPALFCGRVAELRNLHELIGRSRALTLVGPGGIGKSQLARRLAYEVARRTGRGVYLADLDELMPGMSVWSRFASALGFDGSPIDSVVELLTDRDALLVIDNCDPRLDECAWLAAELLRRRGRLQLLATCREPLRMDGEHAWTVPPLSLPATDPPDLDHVESSDAVRFFVACVQVHHPEYGLTAQNAGEVIEICRRVGGSPLLIQTLASQAASHGLQDVALRLDATYLLDVGNTAQLLPRHRSLRASIDWDYAWLTPFERTLLARLAVFAGGWTLEAAEAICAGVELPVTEIAECLSRLVSRSLVAPAYDTEPPRYRMNDTVHVYASQLLRASHNESTLERKHAEYLIALGTRLGRVYFDGAVVEELEHEHNNLIAALGRAYDTRATDLAFRLAVVGYVLWYRRSLFAEGRTWLSRLLELMRSGDATYPRTCIASLAGHLALVQGEVEQARQLASQALETARAVGEPTSAALALWLQLLIALHSGDSAHGAALLEATEAALQDVQTEDDVKRVLELAMPIVRASIFLELNEIRRADELASQAGVVARARENRFWLARAQYAQGMVALRRRQHAVARWLIERAKAIQSVEADTDGLVDSQCALGEIELSLGAFRAALDAFKEAFVLANRAGLRLGQIRALEGLACALARSDAHAAVRLAAAGQSLRAHTGARAWPHQRRRVLVWLQRGLGHPLPADSLTSYSTWSWADV